jgi:hypothetical protein
MVSLSENGKVYRKEGYRENDEDEVNGQFAHEGGKYNIFLYAGGVLIVTHRWREESTKEKRRRLVPLTVMRCRTGLH